MDGREEEGPGDEVADNYMKLNTLRTRSLLITIRKTRRICRMTDLETG